MTDAEINNYAKVTNVDFKDRKIFNDLYEGYKNNTKLYESIREMLIVLSVCHTILTEKN